MKTAAAHLPATIWMVDDIPARMVFAGHRWTVTDTPTRPRSSVWGAPLDANHGLDAWRFQGTDDDGNSLVFDVFKSADGWHVHRSYE